MATPLPPAKRSRTGLRLTAAAAAGRFELQCCARCSAVQYPPREACHRCLSVELEWTLQSGSGQLIAQTTLFHSHEAYFRQRLPWRLGLVRLEAGPTVVTHVHRSVPPGPAAVRVTVRLDKAGQAALIARPPGEDTAMNDDPHIREMSCDPGGLNVFITDGTSVLGQSLKRDLIAAGAKQVWAGEPLDVRDAESVRRAAESFGSDVDILVNNVRHEGDARTEMEVNYFGLLHLMEHFAPRMQARAAAGAASGPGAAAGAGAGGWVNLLSVDALCSLPSQPTFSASMAAALSLSQTLRARMRPSGLRVINVFAGPTSPDSLSRSVIEALREGAEDVYPGDVAQQWLARWLESPKVLEREVTR